MTKLDTLLILLITMLSSCGQSNSTGSKNDTIDNLDHTTNNASTKRFYLDTNVIAILRVDNFHPWLFKNAKSMDLTNDDLSKVDLILKTCISSHNAKQDTTKDFSAFID